MGWGSATGLFDAAVDVALTYAPTNSNDFGEGEVPKILKKAIISDMYTKVDWNDWDTQSESRYFYPYLLDLMHDLGEIDDDDFYELEEVYKPV